MVEALTDLGAATSYDELQAIMRARADALGISRETIDEIAGVPRGYAAKTLAEVPMRKLGPDTLGPMLGALGLKLVVAEDAAATAKYAARASGRNQSQVRFHSTAVHFKISLRTLKRRSKNGGLNSRKYMTPEQARELALRANSVRWEKAKLKKIKAAESSEAVTHAPGET